MEPSFVEAFIFKSLCFAACLAAAVYVFMRTILEKVEKAAEPEVPVVEPKPPKPEKHGGVKCEACTKDDPDKKAFVNSACKHVLCELCIYISKASTIKSLVLCPDGVHRVRLRDFNCKVCSHKNGSIRPHTTPIVRTQPTILVVPSLFRSPSTMVEVVVGAKTLSSDTFTAPECILTGRSKLFQRRLEGNTASARDKRLKLPDHDPKTFGHVLEFMYSGKITEEIVGSESKPTILDFFDVWALASFLEMGELCNYCAWSIMILYDAGQKLDLVKLGHKYSLKDASDLMKQLIVDFRVWSAEGITQYWVGNWPQSLLCDTGKAYRSRILSVPSNNPLDRVENYYIIPVPSPA